MRPLDHPRGRDPGPAPSQVLLPELPARARVHEVRDAGEQPLADGYVGGLGKHDLALGEASREVLREVLGVPLDELPVQGLGGDDLPEEVRRRPGGDLAAASAGDAGDRTAAAAAAAPALTKSPRDTSVPMLILTPALARVGRDGTKAPASPAAARRERRMLGRMVLR